MISNKIYSLVKIRDFITTHCALTIYKQIILPLFDYSGFILISCNISDRMDLQKLQNDVLRICYNVKLRDRVSIARMHSDARLLSLEQRRQVLLMCLMFVYKERHENVRKVYGSCGSRNFRRIGRRATDCFKKTVYSEYRDILSLIE